MKRKKDWRKYLRHDEPEELEKLEGYLGEAVIDVNDLRREIRTIMLRCWARMNRVKKRA